MGGEPASLQAPMAQISFDIYLSDWSRRTIRGTGKIYLPILLSLFHSSLSNVSVPTYLPTCLPTYPSYSIVYPSATERTSLLNAIASSISISVTAVTWIERLEIKKKRKSDHKMKTTENSFSPPQKKSEKKPRENDFSPDSSAPAPLTQKTSEKKNP